MSIFVDNLFNEIKLEKRLCVSLLYFSLFIMRSSSNYDCDHYVLPVDHVGT